MNDDQLLRYSRHILLPDIDIEGQEKLLSAHVVIVGLGGLGSPIAMYLASSGIGKLTLIDHDTVDLSNLQRQIIHTTERVGQSKVQSAKAALEAINPDIEIETIEQRADGDLLETIIKDADLVMDATDNFEIRFSINELCIRHKTPAIFGAAVQLEGQILVFDPEQEDSPCYQCLYQSANDQALNCAENGIAAPVVGMIGTTQAMEALRLLIGIGKSSAGFLQVLDAKDMSWRKFKLPRRENCIACNSPNGS